MGEITDALRRARAEQEAEKREATPEVGAIETPRPSAPFEPYPPPPPAGPVDAAQPPARISRDRVGFWQARAVHLDRPGAVAERFRHLAVRVRRELANLDGQALVVASALREEGKTVTSCNLALALASMAAERRVALIDLDLRRPSVARAMGVQPRVGIDRVLRGDASLASARLPTDFPSFDLYLAGQPTRNAHELLSTPALPRMLAELREQYAVIIADSPPVLLVPDVPLIVSHFDACLVVARAGKTARSSFQEMLNLLPRDRLLGGFLNEVRSSPHATEYGYYLGEDEAADDENDS